MRTIVILLLLACTACSGTPSPTACRGTYQPANPGKWSPTPADFSAETNR